MYALATRRASPARAALLTVEPILVWRAAHPPNYGTNANLEFPYSEYPRTFEVKSEQPPTFVSTVDYVSTKLPDVQPLTRILDFWGEGRLYEDDKGKITITGFTNSYNANHQFQLVSNLPDLDKKIPNRIPTLNHDDVSIEKYVPDSSFYIITLMGAPIIAATATEMTRLIRDDDRSVIVTYGIPEKDKFIHTLQAALNSKGFVLSPLFELSSQLLEPTFIPKLAFCPVANVFQQATDFFKNGEMDNCATILCSLYRSANPTPGNAARVALQDFFAQIEIKDSYRIFSLGYELQEHPDGPAVMRDYMNANVRRIVIGDYSAVKLVISFGAAESYLCPYDKMSDASWQYAFFGSRSYFAKDSSSKYREGEKFRIELIPPGQLFRIKSNFGVESFLCTNGSVSSWQWAFFGSAGYFRDHASYRDGQYFRLYPVSGGEQFQLVSSYGTAISVLLSNGKVPEGDWKQAYFGNSTYFNDPTYRDSQFLTLSFVD